MTITTSFATNRRAILAGSAAAVLAGALPGTAFARAETDKRLVFLIQRGAADGLGTLAPTGDPAFAALRGAFAEDFATGARAGDFFTLHSALAQTAQLYTAGEALFVHAAASPYRERSHFDGQNILETGGHAAYLLRDGWLNRFLSLLPSTQAKAIALSPTVPMVLRGGRDVASFAPSALPGVSDDLVARVSAMYDRDPQLHGLWSQAVETRQATSGMAENNNGKNGQNGAAVGQLAAKMLVGDGARIAVIETLGWDTHAAQRTRLALNLRGLDALLAALKAGLGPVWQETLVVIATEFGRTVALNGTGGTDHGTGALAWLVGGAVRGGRVLADWPGLKPANLLDGRDLKPTIAIDNLIAGALAEHFGLDPVRVARTVFPEGLAGGPISGLVRA